MPGFRYFEEHYLHLDEGVAKGHVLQQWSTLEENQILPSSTSRRLIVRCSDEADMTIYRLCALHRAEQTRNLGISPDSDYSYIPSCNEDDGVLSMVRKQPGATRYLKSPWELTNVSSLQSFIPAFPWQTDVQRLLAVTLLVTTIALEECKILASRPCAKASF
jgi:hypothetical protein